MDSVGRCVDSVLTEVSVESSGGADLGPRLAIAIGTPLTGYGSSLFVLRTYVTGPGFSPDNVDGDTARCHYRGTKPRLEDRVYQRRFERKLVSRLRVNNNWRPGGVLGVLSETTIH